MKIWGLLPLLLASSALAQGFVVFIPGAGSSGAEVYVKNIPQILGNGYFTTYQAELTSQGVDSMVCPKSQDSDTRSIEEREDECVQLILNHEKERGGCIKRDVVLMGHSMGGLIARELAQDPRVQSCIKTVTTISTPHRGSEIADFAIDHVASDGYGLDFYGDVAKLIGFTPDNLRYLAQLRVNRTGYPASSFAAQDIPDNAAVQYFSISTSFNDWFNLLEIPNNIIAGEIRKLGMDHSSFGVANDGIVPEYSQIHGTYLGHVDANHFEAACVDLVKMTPGCARAKQFLIPILASQASF